MIRTTTEGGVFTITLDRPDKMNALTPAMHAALGDAFDHFAADPALRVCVVTGAGHRAFCAGSDLASLDLHDANAYPASGYAGIARRFDSAKPVIAMVNGLCLGGGFELALACDMIVAADSAVFGLPEPKIGLIAIGGGVHRLVRQIGLKQAMGPLLTGDTISAAEGLRLGFVSEVVAADGLSAHVAALCARIMANAPLAVELTKALAHWSLDQPSLADAMAAQDQHPAWQRWLAAEDTREGPRAFIAKRPPEWQGR
jgi:crotonobetainyl-CoA hydratase